MSRKPTDGGSDTAAPAGWVRALQSPAIGFGVVTMAALALRLLYLQDVLSSLLLRTPTLDAGEYLQWAAKIVEGDWLGRSYPVFDQGPLYPYFLAVMATLGGQSPTSVALVQVVLSAVTAGLILLLARHLGGASAGLIAGVIAAGYGMFIYFSSQALMETLLTFLNVLLLLTLMSAMRRPASWKWLASGALLGLSAAGRGTILFFGLLGAAAIAVTFGARQWRAWVGPIALLTGACLVTISPITLHNTLIGGDRVLLSATSGHVLYMGNTLTSDGLSNRPPSYQGRPLGVSMPEQVKLYREVAKSELQRPEVKPSEVSAFWTRKTVEGIAAAPGAWLAHLARKLKYYFNAYEVPNVINVYFSRRFSRVLQWPLATFGMLLPFGLLGMAVQAPRWREASVLYAFFLAQVLGVVAFFVVDRYRLAVVPVLIVFASQALLWLCERIRRLELASLGVAAIVLLAGFAVAYQRVDEISFFTSYGNLGILEADRGQTEEALRNYDEALRLDPRFYRFHQQKGQLLMKMGRREQASESLQLALRFASDANDGSAVRYAAAALQRLGVLPSPGMAAAATIEGRAAAAPPVRAERKCQGVATLPSTGQTACWDVNGAVVACGGTGQDGDTQTGAALVYVDRGDGTIADATTGLVWEKLSNDGSIHDVGNAYTWTDAIGSKIATLNRSSFAGYTDWRLPNSKELISILNLQSANPSVSAAFNTACTPGCTVTVCSCTLPAPYWSSTSYANLATLAYDVYFSDGFVSNAYKTVAFAVRAVRGGC